MGERKRKGRSRLVYVVVVVLDLGQVDDFWDSFGGVMPFIYSVYVLLIPYKNSLRSY